MSTIATEVNGEPEPETPERCCSMCEKKFPPEEERGWLAKGTDVCSYHAGSRVLAVYLSNAAARAWLRLWEERFRAAVLAADVVPDELLERTRFLE